jgi:ADP-heptose:LPS heptosyltransferase
VKILVIRFSSIGDIILTTPVIRALKQQRPDDEVHYLTKSSFSSILDNNPHIDKLITFEHSYKEVLPDLKRENYDRVIDLHHNIRTLKLKMALGKPSTSFPKLNIRKWLLVRFKKVSMPDVHVVDRYFKAVEKLGVKNDQKPCEFHLKEHDLVSVQKEFGLEKGSFLAVAIGAQFFTKRMPPHKLVEVLEQVEQPVVLCGGPMDQAFADDVIKALPNQKMYSACGSFSLAQSASIVSQSSAILTNDTGLMHIATCFGIPVISVWGNTIPELGMYPYYPKEQGKFVVHEVNNLSCRPCSKIGFQQCPKGHFKCMELQDSVAIASSIREIVKD